MDAMEQMRQVATAPAAAPRGLGTPIDNASIDRLTAAIGTGAVPSARVSPQAPAGYDPSLTPVGIDAARVHARAAQDRAIAADAFAQNTPVAAGTPLGGYPNVTTPALNTQRADLQQSFRAQENADLSGVKSINFDPRSQPNRTTVAASMQTPTSVAGSPTQVAANRPANTPAQVAMTTRSRSPGPAPKANPATGVDVLTPARQATEYARAQYTPARSQVATNELGVETVGNTGMTQAQIDVAAAQVGSQTSVDDEDQTVAANEDTDTAPAVTQPPPKETFNPKTIKTVTATGVEKPATLTQALKDVFSRKKDSKPRGLKGNLAVLAGDLAMGAAGPVGLFNAGVQIATGKSIPGHIWSATHGEYGPNQYKGSQHTGTSNREATSTTKPVAEPRPNTADEEPGTTFEEKYLAFNDPTWRPTPLQRFGKVEPTWTPPTHPYTS